jgi:hypothetical protein
LAIAVLGVAALAALGNGLASDPAGGLVAVHDAEAATLYGGGFDGLFGTKTCNGTGTGCQLTSCYNLNCAGSREAYSKACGSSDCGTVPDDNGPCTGG